jgi:hypothetical protein
VPEEEQRREGVLQTAHAGELRAVDDPALVIYERVLPALAGSAARFAVN